MFLFYGCRYGVAAAEFKGLEDEPSKQTTARCLLFAVHFFRIVLDEAHFIKNRHSLTSRACCGMRADRRWVLSGTPIQNRLEDLSVSNRPSVYAPPSLWHGC